MDEQNDPIIIAADSLNPRLVYICDLLFSRLLGLRFLLVSVMDVEDKTGREPDLFYTKRPPGGRKAWLQPSGWLEEERPPAFGWKVPQVEGRVGFFFPVHDNRSILPYDAFASLCWLASLGEHFLPDQLDNHGRCTVQYDEPVAHITAAECLKALEQATQKSFSPAPSAMRHPDWFITIDVDQPWKHAHKGWGVTWGGLLKDLVLLRMPLVKERLASRRGKDPYEVYDLITQSCPPDKTTFFFLLNGNHANDSRFFSDNVSYAALMRKLSNELSYPAGIHPSYDTYVDYLLLREQSQALEKVLGHPVRLSRQHYLRFMLPLTFHYLIDSGITQEYSLCPLKGTGFVNGFCISYPWFDLYNNEPTGLMLCPSVVMDRGLLNAGMTKAQGETALNRIREKVREVGGEFRIILHNETFSDNEEWRGWTAIYLSLIQSLKEKGV